MIVCRVQFLDKRLKGIFRSPLRQHQLADFVLILTLELHGHGQYANGPINGCDHAADFLFELIHSALYFTASLFYRGMPSWPVDRIPER